MIRPTAHRRVPFLNFNTLCLSALLLLGACTSIPKRPGGTIETVPTGQLLEMKSPIDVAVAPIDNQSGVSDLPVAMLREAFHKGLIKRRYSPLGLEYTDQVLRFVLHEILFILLMRPLPGTLPGVPMPSRINEDQLVIGQ